MKAHNMFFFSFFKKAAKSIEPPIKESVKLPTRKFPKCPNCQLDWSRTINADLLSHTCSMGYTKYSMTIDPSTLEWSKQVLRPNY